MRPSPYPLMRISISCFAVSAGRDLHMSRPIPLRQMQRRLSTMPQVRDALSGPSWSHPLEYAGEVPGKRMLA